MNKLLVFLLLALSPGCSNSVGISSSITKEVLVVDKTNSHWSYTPDGNYPKLSIDLGKGIVRQIPRQIPCCKGLYQGTIDTRNISQLKDPEENQIGILFPSIGGFAGLLINDKPYFLDTKDYSTTGPLVALNKTDYAYDKIQLKVFVDTFRGGYAGM